MSMILPFIINWWPQRMNFLPLRRHRLAVQSIAISSNSGSRITRFRSFITRKLSRRHSDKSCPGARRVIHKMTVYKYGL
jgi:hypothetical protein